LGGPDHAEVIFLELAQFYQPPKENPAVDSMIAALREMTKGFAVKIQLASLANNIIEDIKLVTRVRPKIKARSPAE
jgi:hypothetical protein